MDLEINQFIILMDEKSSSLELMCNTFLNDVYFKYVFNLIVWMGW